MKSRIKEDYLLVVGLYIILAALLSTNCVRITEDTRQEHTVTGPNTSTPAPTANPSPNAPPVATVNIGEFTARDGVNCGAPPSLLIGCKAFITCTPRDGSGNDLGSKYIPEWSTIGTLIFNQTSVNFYNGRLECDSVGQGVVACKVGGVTGSYQLTCVAAP